MAVERQSRWNKPPDRVIFAVTIIIAICVIVSSLASALISAVILKDKDLRRKAIYIFVASLCINGIFDNSTCSVAAIVDYAFPQWRFGQETCLIQVILYIALVGATFWHMALIASHRLLVVCFNNTYRKFNTNLYILTMLVLVRIIPVLPIAIMPFRPIWRLGETVVQCEYASGIVAIVVLTNQIILPSLIILVFYLVIMIFVYRATAGLSSLRHLWLKEHRALFKVFVMIYCLIVLGYMPWVLVRMFDRYTHVSAEVYAVLDVMCIYSRSCNPVLYGFMDYEIRQKVYHIFTDRKGKDERVTPFKVTKPISSLKPDSSPYFVQAIPRGYSVKTIYSSIERDSRTKASAFRPRWSRHSLFFDEDFQQYERQMSEMLGSMCSDQSPTYMRPSSSKSLTRSKSQTHSRSLMKLTVLRKSFAV